jgi:hypothetical protein
MAGNGHVDGFDSDDFDDDAFINIPSQTLQALEHKAVLASQQPTTVNPTRPTPVKPRQPLSTIQNNVSNQDEANQGQGQQEEVVNLDDYTIVHRPTYASNHGNTTTNSQWIKPLVHRGYGSGQSASSQRPPKSTPGSGPDLQAIIQRLEKEKLALKQAAETAVSRAQAKSGEVAILRQRLDKSTIEYEQRIEALKQTQLEAAVQSKADLDALKRDREKIETDRKFLEHDLALEAGRSRQSTRMSKKTIIPANVSGPHARAGASPVRGSKIPFGDGFQNDDVRLVSPTKKKSSIVANHSHVNKSFNFDDEVVVMSSPSKSRDGTAPSTPNQRLEKKRRRGDQSPGQAVELPLKDVPKDASPWQLFTPFSPDPEAEAAIGPVLESKATERLHFLQQILEFRVPGSEDRLLEVLGQHSLPSDPNQKLSKLLLDKLTGSGYNDSGMDTGFTFCVGISELWSAALREKYYVIIDLMVSVVQFVLGSKRYAFIRELVEYTLPPAMETINLVAFPISAKSYNESQGIKDESKPPPKLDMEACLDLIILMSFACQDSPEHLASFWKIINIHWVLCLLMEAQPMLHVNFICSLLQTSAQTTSFGPIFREDDTGTAKNQEEIEFLLVERLTSLLFQVPAAPSPDSPLEMNDILTFRLVVLQTLQSMSLPPRNGQSLAQHNMAIGRIIQFLYESIDFLYAPSSCPTDTHDLTITCVNTTMRLLYHILTQHASTIDIREKLKMVQGGAHLHLIALTRLAFCESIILEKGIDPAVSDAAHVLLDEFLSPIEGEQLLRMFPSADSTGVWAPMTNEMEEDIVMGADEEVGINQNESMEIDS